MQIQRKSYFEIGRPYFFTATIFLSWFVAHEAYCGTRNMMWHNTRNLAKDYLEIIIYQQGFMNPAYMNSVL